MINVNRFYKTILVLLIICFACVAVGAFDMIRSQTIGSNNHVNRTLLIGLAFCVTAFLLIRKSFRWLDTLNERGCFFVSLAGLLLAAGLLAAFSFSARMSQFVDSIDVMDTAFYLRKHAEATEDLPFIRYVGSFGNNYPTILFESFLIKILTGLGVRACEMVLDHLNVVFLWAAVALAWLIVRETGGLKAAAKTTVLFLLNPFFYLLVTWTYSMTYSLPMMMGVLYLALRLKKSKSTAGGILMALGEGLLAGGGFLIRATTVFPLIAAVLVWFPSVIRHRIIKKRVIQVLCFLFAMILVLVFVNIQVDRKFGKIRHMNMPLSFWLLLGSHGDGSWNDADLDAVMAVRDPADRSGFALEQAWQNYSQAGLDGLLDLWNRKMNVTWTNGGFFHWSPAVSEGNSLSEYYTGSGARNQLLKLYSQAFRLLLIVCFLLACLVAVFRKNVPEIVMIMLITVFGGVVFHSVWETNVRYSVPFLLPMLVAAGYGISRTQEDMERKERLGKPQKNTIRFATLGILIVAFASLNSAMKEEKMLSFYRVYSTGNTREYVEIEPQGFQRLDQDFYTKKTFNTVFIKAAIPAQKARGDCSGYDLSIMNDEGKVLYSMRVSPDLVGNDGIKVSFDPISGYNHYHIRLQKTEPEKESIRFYTHHTNGMDTFRGILTTDGGAAYPSDLMVDVYEEKTTALLTDKARIIVVASLLLITAVALFVPVRNRRKDPCT